MKADIMTVYVLYAACMDDTLASCCRQSSSHTISTVRTCCATMSIYVYVNTCAAALMIEVRLTACRPLLLLLVLLLLCCCCCCCDHVAGAPYADPLHSCCAHSRHSVLPTKHCSYHQYCSCCCACECVYAAAEWYTALQL
jgi:hypothetical protein